MPQRSPLMQSESSRCDETPCLLWGLDPVFVAFAKLYIRDILAMKESRQMPGIFLYNGHPIKQVDVLGTVIAMKERDTFYSYGVSIINEVSTIPRSCAPGYIIPSLNPDVLVDDSTGVINCICWKKPSSAKSSPAAPGSARELSVISKLEKLQETIEQRSRVELGDVIRVRGYLRTYREEREVHATTYYKVDDPMWNIQITRMLELPDLYRRVYDQPFHSPASEREEASSNPGALDLASLTRLLSEKVREFLLEKKVHTFYQQELEAVASLLSLANQPVIRGSCSDQMEFKNATTSKAIHRIFKNAIQLLQEKGLVFQKDGGFDNLYYVTREDQDLHRRIHRIIQEDCQKPKHMEKGCHFRHILACAHLSVHPGLSEAVLQQVLELLEDRSDIVGTAERYYMAF